jgi:hypothetical protein
MILSEIRKAIDRNFKTESLMSAQRYSQGYIDGLKKYEVINLRDWHDLNNYISEKLKEKLNLQVEKVKSWDKNGRYIKLPKEG